MAFVNSFIGTGWISLPMQRGELPSVCGRGQPKNGRVKLFAKRNVSSGAAPKETGPRPKGDWSPGKTHAPRQQRGGGRRFRGYVRSQGKSCVAQKLPPNPPGLRVASGSARGRRIKSPNVYLRPMMAKVREAVFSMLFMLDALRRDGTCLDLFAGCGSVGIEALSRGMQRAVFVDYSRECVESINNNLANCEFSERGLPVCSRVEQFVKDGERYNNGRHYDLITITPPYEEVDYGKLMKTVSESNCVGEGTFVVVEYPVELGSFPPSIGHRLVGVRNRRYGRTVIAVYACQPDIDVELRPEEFVTLK